MKNQNLFFILFATALSGLFAVNAWTSFFSASEFWPVTLAPEIWNPSTQEVGVFYKPVFHAILSAFYVFDLSNERHLQVVRIFFAGIGIGILFLYTRWLRQLRLIQTNMEEFLIISFLVCSSVVFSQFVKIRSDILALFFLMILLNLASQRPLPWGPKRFVAITAIQFLLLGSTPRALFHDALFIFFVLIWSWNSIRSGQGRSQFLIGVLGPILSIGFVFFSSDSIMTQSLKNYFHSSTSANQENWILLQTWISSEPLYFASLIGGFGLLLFSKANFKVGSVGLFLLAAASFLGADLKTTYLLASLFPFLLFPLVVWSHHRNRLKLVLTGLIIGNLISHAIFNHTYEFWQLNKDQLGTIEKLSEFLNKNPSFTYLDGLGLLPRSKQIKGFLGPNDPAALDSIRRKTFDQRPSVILYTGRIFLLGQDYTEYLMTEYRQIAPNLFIRKDLEALGLPDLKVAPVFLFNQSLIQ